MCVAHMQVCACVHVLGYKVHSYSQFRTVCVVYMQVCACVHLPGYKVHSYSQFRTVSLTCDSSLLLVTRWAELALETRISCRSVAKKGSAWQQDLFRLNTLRACNFTVKPTIIYIAPRLQLYPDLPPSIELHAILLLFLMVLLLLLPQYVYRYIDL